MSSPGLKITILGCGTSAGVPRIGGDWGKCDPTEPKNRRSRASVLLQSATTTVLIDAGPDLRAQLLGAGVGHLDAVLLTHDHADHTHGLDELRVVSMNMGRPVPVYADASCLATITSRFHYAFNIDDQYYKPFVIGTSFDVGDDITIGDLTISSFVQDHGNSFSCGFRVADFAYSTDVSDLDDEAFDALAGVTLWIVDALQMKEHPTHTHLAKTLQWIDRVGPTKAILTHMAGGMDYGELTRILPTGVKPGFDGMTFEV